MLTCDHYTYVFLDRARIYKCSDIPDIRTFSFFYGTSPYAVYSCFCGWILRCTFCSEILRVDPWWARACASRILKRKKVMRALWEIHIRIYIYGYFLAVGLCTMIFVGEHLHFHGTRISGVLGRAINGAWCMVKRIKSGICLFANVVSDGLRKLFKRMRMRFFPYSLISNRRRLTLANHIATIQRA